MGRLVAGSPGLRHALLISGALALASCGVPGGAHDRSQVEYRTCLALLERSGRSNPDLTATDFAASLQQLVASGRPYSSLEPFTHTCRFND